MKCIKCKQDKSAGRICLHGYHRIIEKTDSHIQYEQQEKLEPLFICQDCIRKSLSKFHQFGYVILPIYLLVLIGSIYALVTLSHEPAYVLFFGFFAFMSMISILKSIEIIRNIQTDKFVNQECYKIANWYISKRAFKESFSFSTAEEHLNTNDLLWFEVADDGVHYLGHATKKGKKLVPSTDTQELRQAKEAVAEEMLKQNVSEDTQ